MAKNTFNDFSTTASSNTDIAGIDIQGTAAVANFDNALRTLMAILRTDLDNGQVFVTKAAGYTALAADNNAFYEFTAAATLALTAAATLAADWHMMVFANGGAVTIDPDGAELINGAATLVVADGNAAFIICTGSAFKAIHIKTLMFAKGADVASANALTLGDDGNYFDITGTTAITSITTKGVGTVVKLHFDGILTLTHHSTDLVLPGGVNITTAAGDEAEFIEYATGDWRCVNYQRAAGLPNVLSVQTTGSVALSTNSIEITTAIPVGVQRVFINTDVLTISSGSAGYRIELGSDSGGYPAGVYNGVISTVGTSTVTSSLNSTAYIAMPGNTAIGMDGTLILEKQSGDIWKVSGAIRSNATATSFVNLRTPDLAGALSKIRFTTGSAVTFGGNAKVWWEF